MKGKFDTASVEISKPGKFDSSARKMHLHARQSDSNSWFLEQASI